MTYKSEFLSNSDVFGDNGCDITCIATAWYSISPPAISIFNLYTPYLSARAYARARKSLSGY